MTTTSKPSTLRRVHSVANLTRVIASELTEQRAQLTARRAARLRGAESMRQVLSATRGGK